MPTSPDVAASTPLLEAHEVTKRYGERVAVNRATFTLPAGKVIGLLGPNGAGKTSLMRMLTGLLAPDEGTVRFMGTPWRRSQQDLLGYMPEERGLYKKMVIQEVLVYLAQLKGLSKADANAAVTTWLERFNLADRAQDKVQSLSKGLQQLIQFIGTVAHGPKLLILDEPFSGLDPINQETLERAVHQLADDGAAVVLSTHRMEQVEQLCQELVFMHRGQVVLTGEVEAIRTRYRGNQYLLETAYDPTQLTLPEGATVDERRGRTQLLTLPDPQAAQALLNAAMNHGVVERFEWRKPTLREVFRTVVNMPEHPTQSAA